MPLQKLQCRHSNFAAVSLQKSLQNLWFPKAVGWVWGRVIKFRNAVEPLKLVTQAGKHLITQNGGQQNQKSHDNSEPGC
jgi:hypothetical protein